MAADGDSPIYRDLMRFRPEGLTANAWAVKAGVSRTVWADMRRHGNPSRRTLEKLLTVAGSSLAEFEALRVGGEAGQGFGAGAALGETARGWRGAPVELLPLLATSMAGEWNAGSGIPLLQIRPAEIVERLPRPPSLASDRHAYAISVVGESMLPRFRRGRRIAVSPGSAVAVGDDVLVRLEGGLAVIGELLRQTSGTVELHQFNPPIAFEIGAGMASVEKIAGELI